MATEYMSGCKCSLKSLYLVDLSGLDSLPGAYTCNLRSQTGSSHLVSETITAAHHTLPVNATDSPLDACFLPSILRSLVSSLCRETQLSFAD